MKVNRKKFLQELSELYPVMGKGDTNISANNYTFVSDSNGVSFICATNNSVAVLKPTEFSFDRPFRVSGNLFFQLVKKIKDTEIDIEVGSNFVTIKTESIESQVALIPPKVKNFIDMIVDIPDEFMQSLPVNFDESLKKCIIYVDSSIGSSLLSYIYADGSNMCVANNSAIKVCTLDSEVSKMFIPAKDVACIKGFNLTHYVLKDDVLYFKADNGAFIVMQTASGQERYPVVITESDYTPEELVTSYAGFTVQALFDTDGLTKFDLSINDKQRIIESLKTCNIFLDSDDCLVDCEFNAGKLRLKVFSSNGNHSESIKLESEIEPFTVKIASSSFIDLLSHLGIFYIGSDRILMFEDKSKYLLQVQR